MNTNNRNVFKSQLVNYEIKLEELLSNIRNTSDTDQLTHIAYSTLNIVSKILPNERMSKSVIALLSSCIFSQVKQPYIDPHTQKVKQRHVPYFKYFPQLQQDANEAASQVEGMECEIEQLQKTIKSLNTQLNEANKAKIKAITESLNNQQELSKKNREYDQLDKKYQRLQQSFDLLESDYGTMQKEKYLIELEDIRLNTMIKNLEAKLENALKVDDSLLPINDQLQRKINKQDETISKLKEHIVAISSLNRKYAKKLAILDKE